VFTQGWAERRMPVQRTLDIPDADGQHSRAGVPALVKVDLEPA
jgi:hypothetical protein